MKEELKKNVSMITLLRDYGHFIGEYKKTFHCPFHNDSNPSAVIYNNKEGDYFMCFGCSIQGDIFTIVGILENTKDFKRQLAIINEKYGR